MSTSHSLLFHLLSRFISSTKGFETQPHIAVACSGGIDSMTLSHLLQKWTLTHHATLHILIVDHGLRPESNSQCQYISAYWKKKYNALSSILSVPPYVSGNKLAWARQVRYHALQDYCHNHNIFHLFIAHHADDIIESFMIRLSQHLGIHGLASMKNISLRPHVRILRPLLSIPRKTLEDYHSHHSLPLAYDPSNHNDQYDRVLWRHRLQNPSLSTSFLHKTSLAFRKIANLLDRSLHETRSHISFIPHGIALPYPLFCSLHPQAQRLILRDMISYLTPSHRLREENLQKTISTLPLTSSLGKTVCSVRQNLLRIRTIP